MKREDDSELWDLLGKASAPALSPFFARNVLRQIRQKPTWRDRLSFWLRPGRLIPAAGVAMALGLAIMTTPFPRQDDTASDDLPDAVASIDPQDYEVVADLDDLLATDDDSVWSDNESLSL